MKNFFKKSFWLLLVFIFGEFIAHDVYKTEVPSGIIVPTIPTGQDGMHGEVVKLNLNHHANEIVIVSKSLNHDFHGHTLVATGSSVVLCGDIKDKIF